MRKYKYLTMQQNNTRNVRNNLAWEKIYKLEVNILFLFKVGPEIFLLDVERLKMQLFRSYVITESLTYHSVGTLIYLYILIKISSTNIMQQLVYINSIFFLLLDFYI